MDIKFQNTVEEQLWADVYARAVVVNLRTIETEHPKILERTSDAAFAADEAVRDFRLRHPKPKVE